MITETQQPTLHMIWEDDDVVLSLAPLQGRWTAEQYLLLTDQTNRLIEFSNGSVEVLAMPTDTHQVVLRYVFLALYSFIEPSGGMVLFAPLRLQIRADKFREPDILLVRDASDPRRQNRYWLGADLVVEVVSADNPERDTKLKRSDYAEAGIPEYWIVNPEDATITVLVLEDDVYREAGIYGRGDAAPSFLLAGFTVSVDDVFNRQ